METCVRYGGGESIGLRNPPTVKYAGDVSSIKVHAKQKLQIDSDTLLQLSASIGAGLHYDRHDKLVCTLRGKKAYPLASNRFVNVILKGRCDIDEELSQPTPHGALELLWNILDFQKEQDVRLKVGYEIVDKIPYVQIKENNWTFNADINGRWNVRYHL